MTFRQVIRKTIINILNYIPINLLKSLNLKIFRLRRLGDNVNLIKIKNENIFFTNDHSYITRQLFWLGRSGYEEVEVMAWESLCKKSKSILEIGANIGIFTVFGSAANKNSSYRAIEPHPAAFNYLQKNIAVNNIKIKILHNILFFILLF